MEVHDIHDFVVSSQRDIEEEYARIQKRATEDPGTAGDQGEENWATLLKQWLPSYFQIVTKGRILTESGYASPQVDVIVLMPSYPKILLDKKLYLSGGVAAAFECKTTLKAEHVNSAVETCAALRKNLPTREGSPYKELNSTILYGLLAHSHSWKGERSAPIENIQRALWDADSQSVSHPIQCIDFICVADLAAWTVFKLNYLNPKLFPTEQLAKMYGGFATSAYVCHGIGQTRQENYFSPLGVLLSDLFSKLSWTFTDMRHLDAYFRKVNLQGSGQGRWRSWDISIYSDKIRDRVTNGVLSKGVAYDEWHTWF
jgi:hypothetical protein